MCGILAIFCKNTEAYNEKKFSSSLAKIKDRGPDHTNTIKINDNMIFGHNRLKIIDNSEKSNQPFQAYGCTLVFNGCIYNYKEIKKLLKDKYEFKTNGDTEVLLFALIEWGELALEKIEGMYAFIFFDGKKSIIAVDDFNEKPLYYYKDNEKIIIASEIKSIKEYVPNNLNLDLSQDILKEFLYLGFLKDDKTIYKSIKKVLSSEIYYIENNNIFSNKKTDNTTSLTNIKIDDVHNELINSIKLRLISDQPIGLLLSSGIDSILLLTILIKELKTDIKTYSFYEDQDKENQSYVHKITNYLGVNSNIISGLSYDYDASSFREAFDDLNDCETYFPYHTMLKFISANSDIKVILSGTGADELFYGYNKYKYAYDKSIFYKFLKTFVKIPKIKPLSKMANFIGNNNQKFLKLKNNKPFFFDDELDKLFTLNNDKCLYSVMRDFDLKNTLPYSLIPALERASMRNSLENRSPYLSKKLLELTNSLSPDNFFLKEQKNIQRNILNRYIPEKLIPQKKEGFFSTKKINLNKEDTLKYLKNVNYDYNDLNKRDIQRVAIINEFFN